jgi:hypothetical protein
MRTLPVLALLSFDPTDCARAVDPATTRIRLQVNVREVDINAFVRDLSGKLILNLTRDAFRITEDGIPILSMP